ncbi:glycosyltransferase [Chroococcidiopsis sp. CCALA 051]|nr:glycosyltransferase family 1 protein [Chroococcidiopsidales cyanobacterium LEGE 13417]PSM48503.1 glycosyltransferase [Chroococcidiopsis sp. CCALA 051]
MTLTERRSIRILQVVGGMDRGGTETWLMHVLRHIDRDRFQIDFLVHTKDKCAYDEEIIALGSQIIPCLDPSKPWLYARNFKQIMRECSPYDIIHSHIHHFSGYVLYLARQVGIPMRIAHSHLDTLQLDASSRFLRRAYLKLMKQWIARHTTIGLAASRKAAVALFGSTWNTDPSRQVLHCSVDLTPFQHIASLDPVAVRAELGIPEDTFVIGHVGRFFPQKNHAFLVEVAAEVAKREPKMRLLLVGDGLLRPSIERKVTQLDLSDRVIFTGSRSDVPRLMLGAMDIFLFPSLYEGLGLVLIEAQAAGLHCIFSDVVPEEADAIKPLMRRMSLSQPAAIWAEAILALRQARSESDRVEALQLVEQSSFSIRNNIKTLEKLYLECFQY